MNRNWLRALAITLIALPEPVTTVCGMALLAASYAWPRDYQKENSKLEEIIKEYFKSRESIDFSRYLPIAEAVVQRTLNPSIPANRIYIPGNPDYPDGIRLNLPLVNDKILANLDVNLSNGDCRNITPADLKHYWFVSQTSGSFQRKLKMGVTQNTAFTDAFRLGLPWYSDSQGKIEPRSVNPGIIQSGHQRNFILPNKEEKTVHHKLKTSLPPYLSIKLNLPNKTKGTIHHTLETIPPQYSSFQLKPLSLVSDYIKTTKSPTIHHLKTTPAADGRLFLLRPTTATA